jgi:hypothetical protein
MKVRTLISNQLYFGLEPLVFRRGAGRVLARVGRSPAENARISLQMLAQDFRLQPATAEALLQALLAKKLMEPFPGHATDYRLTERFSEFALARVVPPLSRARAKELLDQACRLAEKINDEWTANPLMIHMVAVSGEYMSRSNRISELTLWPVVKRRVNVRRRFGATISKADAVAEIGTALRRLSAFIVVRIVSDKGAVARPFAVPFRDFNDPMIPSPAAARFLAWGAMVRRQLVGH